MSRPAVAFRPALLSGGDADYDTQNRNNRELARAIERLQLPGGAAEVSTPSRVFIGPAKTGVAPWSWTGLNGDDPELAGYELVGRTWGGTAVTIDLQFNGDTAANYGDISTTPRTGARVHTNGGGTEVVTTVIQIPIAASGAARGLLAFAPRADATPEIFAYAPAAFTWQSAAAITRIDLVERTGGPTANALWKLYALMDVAE